MGESSTGHLKWGDWFFDYGVLGSEGLCLVDGFFRGQKMFNKLSLPVIRVKYLIDEFSVSAGPISVPLSPLGAGCGPYNDQITWDTEDFGENLNPIAGPHHLVEIQCHGGNRYVCHEEILVAGVPHFQVAVYARIGAYHIVQSWMLNNDGWVMPRVFSKGLSCNIDHWHHPYWRFDFALGSPEHQRVAVFSEKGVTDITGEGSVVNSWFGEKTEYRITSTQPTDIGRIELPAQAIIVPPREGRNGVVGPTAFSSRDGYIRKFRPEEDRPWPHEASKDIQFSVHEPCVDVDIVFWSICHLFHQAAEGKHHWHSVGPDIRCRPMILADLPPESLRVIDVSGEIAVKDFKLVGKDKWNHVKFADKLLISPRARTGEVVKIAQAGDTTAELILRISWNQDSSVNVQITANLFDELQRVSQVTNQFNVLRDTSAHWGGIHLVDYHRGDPDTADISFDIQNAQQ